MFMRGEGGAPRLVSTPPELTPRKPHNAWFRLLSSYSFLLFFTMLWVFIAMPIALLLSPAFFPFSLIFVLFGVLAGYKLARRLLVALFKGRWLLTYGMVARGEVVAHSQFQTASNGDKTATLITWRYEDFHGVSRKGSFQTFDDEIIAQHKEGSEVTVLFDQRSPSHTIVPSMLKMNFEAPPPVEDRRAKLGGVDLDVAARAPDDAEVFELSATSERVRRGWLWGLRRRIVAGQLELSQESLVQRDAAGEEVGRVDLSQPFVLQRSVWLLPEGEAELGVTVVQRTSEGHQRLRFEVELPQSEVSQQVPVQQLNAPFLEKGDWLRLWSALQFYMASHGQSFEFSAVAAPAYQAASS